MRLHSAAVEFLFVCSFFLVPWQKRFYWLDNVGLMYSLASEIVFSPCQIHELLDDIH